MSYVKVKDQRIPVSKILCVGANYRDHIAEMNPGKEVELPSEPVIFMKPPSAIIHDGDTVVIPKISNDVHHELELIAVIAKDGKHIPAGQAEEYILGYGIGLDLTLRDIQTEAKKKGMPWTIAKGFDTSALISEIVPKEFIRDPNDLEMKLFVNDALRQAGHTSGMIFKIHEILAYVSKIFSLKRGDIIYTGTPAGVGPVKEGDRLRAVLADVTHVSAIVAEE